MGQLTVNRKGDVDFLAASYRLQATGYKLQATSYKLQAKCEKRKAKSEKRKAKNTSKKRQGGWCGLIIQILKMQAEYSAAAAVG